jgi:protoporphyrinogen oxidase
MTVAAQPPEHNSLTPSPGLVFVIGAGPAGLTAAYELTERRARVLVVEQHDIVGGLAQTVRYKGFRFDIGGHRFFTKVKAVNELWQAMLGQDFLTRPRLSRIYCRGRFFHYPLKAFNAVTNLGVFTSARVVCSYVWAKLVPIRPEVSFEDWVSNRFGRRLYNLFFKSYTEKVWGIPCSHIGAQWAAQRIKGLSLRTAITHMLFGGSRSIKSLIDQFEYPRLGPGMMWEAFQSHVEAAGGRVETKTEVVELVHDGSRVERVTTRSNGLLTSRPVGHVISTMAIRDLVEALRPAPPPDVVAAAQRLKYRDFVTVALIIRQKEVFPDNWIYIHDPSVRVGRIQNFKNWSEDMVPDPSLTGLGLEYFCSEGDDLWESPDEKLVELAKRELTQIGLAQADRVVDGHVVRVRKAYPVYDEGYMSALAIVRSYLERLRNLQLVGRNGMHKYNNQDHSMVTAMLAVRNLFGERFNVWAVNAEAEYHEQISDAKDVDELMRQAGTLSTTQPFVPTPLPSGPSPAAARQAD